MTLLERARAIVETYETELRAELPADAYLFDVHTHLGDDIDGMRGRYEELSTLLDRFGFAGAFVFCLDEPDREPGFCVPNDRTLAHAERSQGRLVPFVRLDLTASPIDEARRALDLGARGIKLHPRAQAFALDDERLGPVFELAVERGVPILIHGGRGLPPIAENLEALVRRNEGVRLIIAHAGIADMAALAGRLGGIPGVYFDTSVWSALDLLDLFRQVPPEQIVYASDYPYGRQPNSLHIALRTALVAGFDEEQIRNMLWGNAARIASGEEPLEPSAPQGSAVYSQPLQLARIHQYLSMATPLIWTRQPDTIGVLGLALNTCGEPNGAGEGEAVDRIRELIETARDLWRELPEVDEAERPTFSRTTFSLIHLADIVAVTTVS